MGLANVSTLFLYNGGVQTILLNDSRNCHQTSNTSQEKSKEGNSQSSQGRSTQGSEGFNTTQTKCSKTHQSSTLFSRCEGTLGNPQLWDYNASLWLQQSQQVCETVYKVTLNCFSLLQIPSKGDFLLVQLRSTSPKHTCVRLKEKCRQQSAI